MRRPSPARRIVVVVVPPVDELDLVGPLQVFNSVNRLAGHAIYAIEVVTSQRMNQAEWTSIVQNMLTRGAPASDEEGKVIIDYLAKTLGRQ